MSNETFTPEPYTLTPFYTVPPCWNLRRLPDPPNGWHWSLQKDWLYLAPNARNCWSFKFNLKGYWQYGAGDGRFGRMRCWLNACEFVVFDVIPELQHKSLLPISSAPAPRKFTTGATLGPSTLRIVVPKDSTKDVLHVLNKASVWGGHDKVWEAFDGALWLSFEIHSKTLDLAMCALHGWVEVPERSLQFQTTFKGNY